MKAIRVQVLALAICLALPTVTVVAPASAGVKATTSKPAKPTERKKVRRTRPGGGRTRKPTRPGTKPVALSTTAKLGVLLLTVCVSGCSAFIPSSSSSDSKSSAGSSSSSTHSSRRADGHSGGRWSSSYAGPEGSFEASGNGPAPFDMTVPDVSERFR